MSKEEVRSAILEVRNLAKSCEAILTCNCTLDDRIYKCTVCVVNKMLTISMQASGASLGDAMLQALKDIKNLLQDTVDSEFCAAYCEPLR